MTKEHIQSVIDSKPLEFWESAGRELSKTPLPAWIVYRPSSDDIELVGAVCPPDVYVLAGGMPRTQLACSDMLSEAILDEIEKNRVVWR